MRFAFLHHGDPLAESLWSAIPLNIIRTLRELGHEVVLVGSLNPQAPLLARVKTQVYRRLFKKMYLINRDPAVINQRARDGNQRLKALGRFDAVLIAYPPDAAYLETSDPVIIVHDATWTQLLDFYPGLERDNLAAETIRGGIELDQLALDRCDHVVYCSHWAAAGATGEFHVPRNKVSIAPLGASIADVPTRADLTAYLQRRGQATIKLFFQGRERYGKEGISQCR